jgi:hypothetical protein
MNERELQILKSLCEASRAILPLAQNHDLFAEEAWELEIQLAQADKLVEMEGG